MENTKLLNKGQLENLQAQNKEKAKTLEQHKEGKDLCSTKLEEVVEDKVSATETHHGQQPKSPAQEEQKVTSKKEEPQNHTNTSKKEQPQDNTNRSKNEEPHDHTNTSKNEEPQDHTNTSKQEETQVHFNTSKKEEPHDHSNTSKNEEPQYNTNASKKEEPQNYTNTIKKEEPQKQTYTSKKEEPQNHPNTSNNILIQKEMATSDSHKQSILSKPPQYLEPKGIKGTLQNHVRRLNQKFSNLKEKDNVVKVQKAQPQESSSQINNSLKEEKTELSVSKVSNPQLANCIVAFINCNNKAINGNVLSSYTVFVVLDRRPPNTR